jgi:hypothetical protein
MLDSIRPEVSDTGEIEFYKTRFPSIGGDKLNDFLFLSNFGFWNKARRYNGCFTVAN